MISVRVLKLMGLGAATALLMGGGWMARSGLQQLVLENRELSLVDARIAAAQHMLPQLEKRERFAQLSEQAQTQMMSAGFDASRWTPRRIQRNTITVTRPEALTQLAQIDIAGSDRRLVADGFELAVVSPSAGLFTLPAADDMGVMLNINATVYFPLGQRP
jgi:hypothetical protein